MTLLERAKSAKSSGVFRRLRNHETLFQELELAMAYRNGDVSAAQVKEIIVGAEPSTWWISTYAKAINHGLLDVSLTDKAKKLMGMDGQ